MKACWAEGSSQRSMIPAWNSPRALTARMGLGRVRRDPVRTAFATNDIDGVVALLTDDAWFTMPPVIPEYQGPEAIDGFLRDLSNWKGLRRYRLIPTQANGQPAFGC